jgi:hypothetical protein
VPGSLLLLVEAVAKPGEFDPIGAWWETATVGVRGGCVEHFLLGEPLVAALRDARLGVTTGTVNGAAIAERALAHAPDALTTDAPTTWRPSRSCGGLLAA